MVTLTPEQSAESTKIIQTEIREAMDDERLTTRYLAKKLRAELNAKETKAFKAKGSPKFQHRNG